jgi:hypothetical protein
VRSASVGEALVGRPGEVLQIGLDRLAVLFSV